MATRGQIARLAARIAELVQRADDRPAAAYVWWNLNETEDQAIERYYRDRPEACRAKSIYLVTWVREAAQDGRHYAQKGT